jgi:bifunctional non-homologous end joining protein LigD
MGLRADKKPIEVKRKCYAYTKNSKEPKASKPSITKSKTSVTEKKQKSITGKKIKPNSELLDESDKELSVKLNGQDLKLTNLDKVYWKKEHYTKRDLINYYHGIAPIMLTYMKNRPQSLNRHPNGIDGMSFFQKNVQGKVPNWIETFDEFSESTGETVHYYVCTNEASLVYLANLGCIEMNPWHSTTMNPNNPDYCLIDLDPHEVGFDKVVETAQAVKKVLDELSIPCLVQNFWCFWDSHLHSAWSKI